LPLVLTKILLLGHVCLPPPLHSSCSGASSGCSYQFQCPWGDIVCPCLLACLTLQQCVPLLFCGILGLFFPFTTAIAVTSVCPAWLACLCCSNMCPCF
jgi:hypothetical protein